MINKFHVVSSKVAVLDVSFTIPHLASDDIKWRQKKVQGSLVDEKHVTKPSLIQKLDCILNGIPVGTGHKAAKIYQPGNCGRWMQSIVGELFNLSRLCYLGVFDKKPDLKL